MRKKILLASFFFSLTMGTFADEMVSLIRRINQYSGVDLTDEVKNLLYEAMDNFVSQPDTLSYAKAFNAPETAYPLYKVIKFVRNGFDPSHMPKERYEALHRSCLRKLEKLDEEHESRKKVFVEMVNYRVSAIFLSEFLEPPDCAEIIQAVAEAIRGDCPERIEQLIREAYKFQWVRDEIGVPLHETVYAMWAAIHMVRMEYREKYVVFDDNGKLIPDVNEVNRLYRLYRPSHEARKENYSLNKEVVETIYLTILKEADIGSTEKWVSYENEIVLFILQDDQNE